MIDAFFQSISRPQVVTSNQQYFQLQKENLFDEVNPTISQLEQESVNYAIKVLESLCIDFKQMSKLSFAKSIIIKSLQEVARSIHQFWFKSQTSTKIVLWRGQNQVIEVVLKILRKWSCYHYIEEPAKVGLISSCLTSGPRDQAKKIQIFIIISW